MFRILSINIRIIRTIPIAMQILAFDFCLQYAVPSMPVVKPNMETIALNINTSHISPKLKTED